MLVTEAKEKVCPFMSIVGVFEGSQELWEQSCICGGCMAWQYTKSVKRHVGSFRGVDMFSNVDTKEKTNEETDQGYCKRIEDAKD